MDELRARGHAHEQRYLDHLAAQGLTIVRARRRRRGSIGGAGSRANAEGHACRRRRDLPGDLVRRHLVRPRGLPVQGECTPSDLGDWSYEVTDTKLAREPRPARSCSSASTPSCWRSCRPSPGTDARRHAGQRLHADPLPSRRLQRLRPPAGARHRRLRPVAGRDLPGARAALRPVSPGGRPARSAAAATIISVTWPASRSSQIKSLRALGVNRLADLAALGRSTQAAARRRRKPCSASASRPASSWKAATGRRRITSCSPHSIAEHGLALLPEPTDDDIFLDFEGSHFAEDGVQEYLTGFVARNAQGERVYHALWATTLEEERAPSSASWISRSKPAGAIPRLHIYHFAPYEPAALKRLMGRFATREVELDELLRGGAFVDLHRVVRRALIASVERYSIKELERFFGLRAGAEPGRGLDEPPRHRARHRGRRIRRRSMPTRPPRHRRGLQPRGLRIGRAPARLARDVARRGDCRGADAAAAGAEGRRSLRGDQRARPANCSGCATGCSRACPTIPPSGATSSRRAWLLAHMMECHRREDKAGWWEYFRLLDCGARGLRGRAAALVGLVFEESRRRPERAPLHRYRFPAQELDARDGDEVMPATEPRSARSMP